MSDQHLTDLQAAADRIANSAAVTITSLAGPEHAENVLTAFVIAYGRALTDLRGAHRASTVLYSVADLFATGGR